MRSGVACIAAAMFLAACADTGKETPDKKEGNLSAALWELAVGAEEATDYEKAASYYDRLYERHPEDTRALLGYARNLRYLGLPKESVKSLQTGIEKHGKSADLAIELGKAQLAGAMIADAETTLNEAIALSPERWEGHSALGIIHDRRERFDAAQESYRRALERSPENVSVRNNLALSLAQSGKLDKGIALLEEVVAGEAANPQSRQNLALLYGLRGDFKKAKVLSQIDLPPDLAANNLATFKILHSEADPVRGIELAPRETPPKPKKVSVGATAAPAKMARAAAVAKPAVPVKRTSMLVSLGSANVRKGPSTRHPPVAFLQKGHQVTLLGRSDDGKWSHVLLEDGRRGYVFHKLLRRK